MTVLVTGANGFVGRYLVEYLCDLGHSVVAVAGPKASLDEVPLTTPFVTWEQADLRDTSAVRVLMDKHRPNRVYHLAGIAVTHGVTFQKYLEMNVLATRNVAESVLQFCGSECKLLFVSSAGVYARLKGSEGKIAESSSVVPANDYGVSKAAAECVLWPFWYKGLNFRIARPFNHTGPGQQLGFVCPDLIQRIRRALVESVNDTNPLLLKVGNDSVRDFTDVRDVVRAYVLIQESFNSGEIVNVSSGRGISVHEIIQMLGRKIVRREITIVNERALSDRDELDICIGDNGFLMKRTGWSPQITFEETLRDMWNGVRT